MLILITIGILLVAILGLAAVRTASVLARWLALLAAIAFAVVINLADRTEQRPVQARLQRADLMSDLQDTRTSMLMAAALAGPRRTAQHVASVQTACDYASEAQRLSTI